MISKAPARSAGTRPSGTTTQVVALDLGSQTVRAVEVSLTQGIGNQVSARLLRRGQAALPPRAWDDLALNREAIAASIREALASAGISGRTVVASLPRRLVTLRFARLPQASSEQLRSMVAMEAQQYILFSLDEVILDYFAVPEPAMNGLAGMGRGMAGEDDLQTILLAAARRSLIADIMAIFDRAGVQLQRLSVSALALAEQGARAEAPTALVDLEPGEMDVAVVSDGRLLFTRASALDVSGVTPDIATRRTAEELSRSLTAYQNEFRQKPLGRVYLCGESATGSAGATLAANLSDLLESPVESLQSDLMPGADNESLAYATAVGLAAQAQGYGIAPINLVPNERAEKKAAQSQKQRKQLAALLAVVGVGAGVLWLNGTLQAREKEAQKTRKANLELASLTDTYNTRKKKFDLENGVATDLSKGLDRRHPSVDVLVALTRCLPPTINLWLTQYNFDRSGLLTLRGETKSPTAATDLVLAMQNSGAFTQVKLAYLGDAQDTNNNAAPASAPANANTVQTPKANVQNPVNSNVPAIPGFSGAPGRGGNGASGVPSSPIPQGLPGVNGAPGGNFQGGNFPGGGGNGQNNFNGLSREERRRLRQQFRDQGGFNGGVPGGVPGNGNPGGTPGSLPPGAVPTSPAPAAPNGGPPPGDAAPAANPAPVGQPLPNGGGNPALFFFQSAPGSAQTTIIESPRTRTVGARPVQAVVQPAAAKPAAKPVVKKAAAKPTQAAPLTSFVITCRINDTAKTLVPANMPMPKPTRRNEAAPKSDQATTVHPANEPSEEEVDPDAE